MVEFSLLNRLAQIGVRASTEYLKNRKFTKYVFLQQKEQQAGQGFDMSSALFVLSAAEFLLERLSSLISLCAS